MLRGLRTAWWVALFLSVLSIFGHIAKGIDWEESVVAGLVIITLLSTRKEYYVKTNPRFRTVGLQTAMLSVAAVLIYGTVGFYFLDKKHFQIDFGTLQSIKYTLQNFFLIGSSDLVPRDAFARDFILSIKVAGFASIAFVVYAFVRPHVFKTAPHEDEIVKARELTAKYGNSALDFFKTYSDKLIFIVPSMNAFLAYRVVGNFAVVLEDPVASGPEELRNCIRMFGAFCYDNGLKEFYYRVPAGSLPVYRELSKKSLFLGQEGVVDLSTFTMEGGERKSLRNAIRKVTDTGLKTRVCSPPLSDGLLQKLRAVSDEWLRATNHTEIVFSQGMFVEKELKNQTVITIENKEEKIIAFLNIIPDFARDEGTYDLLRKTTDAPNGTVDYMIVEMFSYFRSIGIRNVNLGFAAMGGLNDPHNFTEQSMKFAYEKIRSFSHFKGLREYKEKFSPVWYDKYLIYNHDYDLLQAPSVLTKVIKP
jgi:phosphatidylglycerol lysyltransferase